MREERPIPFLRAEFPAAAADAVSTVLASGYVGAGRVVDEFEAAIRQFLDAADVVCTSSCTAALSLCYEVLRASGRTKVLSTAMTCAATNLPLLREGLEIVWLDIDPFSGNVTPQALAAAVEEHPDAGFAVIVDWAGMPCAYDEVRAVAKEAGIAIVLDAAQSFGSTVDGRTLPTVGEYICYSFGPTKILSSVEGGAVVTAGRPAPQSMRRARWYGIDRAARDPVNFWQYDITTPGYRYTSNDVFAAVGLQMLRCFDARLEAHRRVADTYLSCLRDVDGIVLPRVAPSVEPNWWMFTVTVERRFDFMRKLQAKNIHVARPHNRNDRLTCFDGTTANELSGLLYFAEHYVCLPIGPWVSQESAERVCDVIRSGW